MKLTTAATAGFCFGVARAVDAVENCLTRGEHVCTLGPLIHNPAFVNDLAKRGAPVIENLDALPAGNTLIIRTHGIPEELLKSIVDKGVSFYDATCPFVKKIQQIVEQESAGGSPVLIAGDENHPEVIAIRSYCRAQSFVFKNNEDLIALLKREGISKENPPVLVSQTTFSAKELKKCVKNQNLLCTNPKIFDTICHATALRQEEAVRLAQNSDLMLVVGGRNSSNTAKLTTLCGEICRTIQIEEASELNNIDFSGIRVIGLTAGASTPVRTIKEVQNTMSDIINQNTEAAAEGEGQALNMTAEIALEDMSPEQFRLAFEESLDKTLNNDQQVVGTVMHLAPNEIQVDIGRKQTGYIPIEEYSNDPTADPMKELHEGDSLNLIIMKTNDAEGTIMLSKKRFDAIKIWEDIAKAREEGTILEGTVVEVVKKGLVVSSNGARVFIPASLSTVPRNGRLEDMLDKKVNFKIVDMDNDKRRRGAVGSIRDASREMRKENEEKFWASAEVGAKFTGTVKSLTDFGAFVDLGGVDGMIHRTELSWKRIKHPSDIVSIGDVVDVYIKALDTEKKKISLGYKKTEDNPWEILKRDYPIGTVCEVKIVSLTTFGAFAEIFPQMEGLIHISQISYERIAKPQDVLSIGDVVTVKITDINFEKKHISLSIKALLDAPEKAPAKEEKFEDEAPVTMSIDDMIAAANAQEAEEAPTAE